MDETGKYFVIFFGVVVLIMASLLSTVYVANYPNQSHGVTILMSSNLNFRQVLVMPAIANGRLDLGITTVVYVYNPHDNNQSVSLSWHLSFGMENETDLISFSSIPSFPFVLNRTEIRELTLTWKATSMCSPDQINQLLERNIVYEIIGRETNGTKQ